MYFISLQGMLRSALKTHFKSSK